MIIGICGLIGAGKGTISDILVDEHDFQKISVADPLKDCIAGMFSYPRNLLEGDNVNSRKWRETKDEYWSDKMGRYITPRILLQEIGTDVMRNNFHKTIWSDILFSRLINSEGNVVVPDIRFLSEMEVIKGLGVLIRVERGPRPVWYEDAIWNNDWPMFDNNPHIPVHESEWGHIQHDNQYTTTIKNDGTLDELRDKITDIMKRFSK